MATNRISNRRRRSLGFPIKQWQRFVISCLSCLLALMPLAPGWAQSPELPLMQTIEQLTPQGLQELIETEEPELATATVHLNGQELFQVAAPAEVEGSNGTELTAQERANEIERRLQRIAQQAASSPDDLDVYWTTEAEGSQPLLYVNGEFLLTVTTLDAESQSHNSLEVRANQLERIVQEALDRYATENQPSFYWRQLRTVALLILGAAILHLGCRYGIQRLNRRKQAMAEVIADVPSNRFTDAEIATALRDQCQARETKGWIDFQLTLLRLAQFGVWFGAIYFVLGLFPESRSLQPPLLNALRLPARIAMVAIATYWLLRLSNRLIDRLFLALQDSSAITGEASQRLGLRFSTFSQVTKSVAGFLLLIIAIITALALLGVQVGPLLTGAGLVGLAFSLASQSLIQDFINGFLILMEDQYGVGDVIVVDTVAGFVEVMNLRITQLRNEEGRLITIPNSKIGIVQNLSKEWSRVDLMIPVSLEANIDEALAVVKGEAEALNRDELWGPLILEPPLLLGVDKLSHDGATIRIWIKTAPLKQWDVGREYRRRLKIAFEQAGINIGIPQQIIHVGKDSRSGSNGYSPFSGKHLTEAG